MQVPLSTKFQTPAPRASSPTPKLQGYAPATPGQSVLGSFHAELLGGGGPASGLNCNHSSLWARGGAPPPPPRPRPSPGSASRSSVSGSKQEQGPESAFTRKIMPAPAARKIHVNRTKWDRRDPPFLVSTGVSQRYTRPSLSL